MVWESRICLQALTSATVLPQPPHYNTGPLQRPGSSCQCTERTASRRRDASNNAATGTRSHQETLEGLIQLPLLLNAENLVIRSSEARAVADGLERLLCHALECVSNRPAQKPLRAPTDLVRVSQMYSFLSSIESDLTLVKALITSSRQIIINQLGPRQQFPRMGGDIVEQQRKRKRITMDDGLLILTCLKRNRLPVTSIAETSAYTHFEAAGQEFLGTVTFFPANPLSSLMMIAHVHQREVRGGGTYCETPRLCINRLLPSDAPVFNFAREGRIADLQNLISQGKATLRDRDTNGMSLLHHSVGHPPMCRFLVENGADVNEIAGKNDGAESLPLLAATTRATTSRRGSAEFEAAKECIKILLGSGADPTISLKSWDSPFHTACTPESLDIFDVFLELGSAFAHINLADSRRHTPLLRMCSWYSTYTRHAFSYLIDHGADMAARDKTGATCLHLAIENAKRPLRKLEFEALEYLIRHGADVYATTTEGISVSEVAYTTSSTDVVYKLGSYRGDLWDAVLASTGYPVSSFRRDWPREKFTARYTRDDFEELWKGRENLCPYFGENASSEVLEDKRICQVDDDAQTTIAKRRSFNNSIRQRTDISVTVDSMEKVTLSNNDKNNNGEQLGEENTQYDQYGSSYVASYSLFADVPNHQAQVPLLWDPSLVHHLMPNPWHDIIPQDEQGGGGGGGGGGSVDVTGGFDQEFGRFTSGLNVWDDDGVMVENQDSESKKRAGSDLGKSGWSDLEIENVWRE